MKRNLLLFFVLFVHQLVAQKFDWVIRDESFAKVNIIQYKFSSLPIGIVVTKLDNQVVFYNTIGKLIIDSINTDVSLDNELITLSRNGKFGLFDNQFNTILPFEYDEIILGEGKKNTPSKIRYFYVRKGKKHFLMNTKGKMKEVKQGIYFHLIDDLFVDYDDNSYCRLVNFKGKHFFDYGDFLFKTFKNANGEYFIYFTNEEDAILCNSKGKEIWRTKVKSIKNVWFPEFSKVAIFQKDSSTYTVDIKGKVTKYDFAVQKVINKDSLFIIRKSNKFGLASKDLEILIQPTYKYSLYPYVKGLYEIIDSYKLSDVPYYEGGSVIDIYEKVIIPKYQNDFKAVGDTIYYSFGNKVFVKLKSGELLTTFDVIGYQEEYEFEVNRFFFVAKSRAIYTHEGKLLQESLEDRYTLTQKGGILVKKSEKYGYYNTLFNLKIPISFDAIEEDKSKGFLIVKLNNLYGLYDLNGDQVLDTKYDKISILNQNAILVEQNGNFSLLNRKM